MSIGYLVAVDRHQFEVRADLPGPKAHFDGPPGAVLGGFWIQRRSIASFSWKPAAWTQPTSLHPARK